MIEKWAYFFKHAPEVIAETLAKIARECPVIGKAFDVLERFNYSPEEQERYDVRDMNADSIASSISDAKKEGKAETQREIALKLQQQGSSEDFIVSVTGLSPEELEQVLAAPKS
jgi:predicted transposase/invertase (TIGR01784 family)